MSIFSNIFLFFVRNIYLIHQGSLSIKLKAVAKLSLAVSPVAYIIEKVTLWSLLNQDFMAGILAAIIIDYIIGCMYHGFKKRDWDNKKNIQGLLTKIGFAATAAILFEILSGMTIKHQNIYDYLQLITRLMVFLYPAGSAFMNMSALTDGAFPPTGWINRIKRFNKDLDVEKLTGSQVPRQEPASEDDVMPKPPQD